MRDHDIALSCLRTILQNDTNGLECIDVLAKHIAEASHPVGGEPRGEEFRALVAFAKKQRMPPEIARIVSRALPLGPGGVGGERAPLEWRYRGLSSGGDHYEASLGSTRLIVAQMSGCDTCWEWTVVPNDEDITRGTVLSDGDEPDADGWSDEGRAAMERALQEAQRRCFAVALVLRGEPATPEPRLEDRLAAAHDDGASTERRRVVAHLRKVYPDAAREIARGFHERTQPAAPPQWGRRGPPIMFNRDQKDHMRWLAELGPEDRCECGWDSKENCERGIGATVCKRKAEQGRGVSNG